MRRIINADRFDINNIESSDDVSYLLRKYFLSMYSYHQKFLLCDKEAFSVIEKFVQGSLVESLKFKNKLLDKLLSLLRVKPFLTDEGSLIIMIKIPFVSKLAILLNTKVDYEIIWKK